MTKLAKRIAKNVEGIDRVKFYGLDEAVKLIKERANAKFNETVEIAMNLGVDPRHSDQMVRGVVNLPNGTGRNLRVGVFAKGAKAEEAKKAGAEVVGAEDLFEIVNKGTIDSRLIEYAMTSRDLSVSKSLRLMPNSGKTRL